MSNIFDSMLSNDPSRRDSQEKDSEGDARNEDDQPVVGSTSTPPSNSGANTPVDVKEVTQELLRYGHIDETRKGALFQKARIHTAAIAAALEPLNLRLQLDEHRGVAFLKVDTNDTDGSDKEWSHPLVRRQRLTLEQSMVVAILRQAFISHEQEAGVGEAVARVAVEDLLPQYLTYFEDSGSDAKNESRLLNTLDQLKTHGIVSEVDKRHEVTVRPLIAHLADPASLNSLLKAIEDKAEMDAFEDAFKDKAVRDE